MRKMLPMLFKLYYIYNIIVDSHYKLSAANKVEAIFGGQCYKNCIFQD